MARPPISGINFGAGWVIPGPLRAIPPPGPLPLAARWTWRLVAEFPKTTWNLGTQVVDGLMVPEGAYRDLEVDAGKDLVVRTDDPAVLEVRPWAIQPASLPGNRGSTRVALYGKREGRVRLEAYLRGEYLMSGITVSVKKPRSYAVRFWYLDGGAATASHRRRAELPGLLDHANLLFEAQTNVHFYDQHTFLDRKRMRLGLDGVDLGRAVSREAISSHILPRIREVHDATIDVHIVLVRELDSVGPDGVRDDALTYSRQGDPRVILLKDVVSHGVPAGKALAHELGHALTLPHTHRLGYDGEGHSGDDRDLMFASCMADPKSMRIRLREADVINPSGL